MSSSGQDPMRMMRVQIGISVALVILFLVQIIIFSLGYAGILGNTGTGTTTVAVV